MVCRSNTSFNLNSTVIDKPSLLHAFGEAVKRFPEREAFVFREARVSYRYAGQLVDELKQQLVDRGVVAGTRILSVFLPRPEAIILLLSAAKLGAVVVGVNPKLSRSEQAYIAEDTRASIVVGGGASSILDDVRALADAFKLEVLAFSESFWSIQGTGASRTILSTTAGDQEESQCGNDIDPDSAAVIIYTSGSTGRPKGALISHRGLAYRAVTMAQDRFDLEAPRQIVDLPVNHIGALASGVGLSLVTAGTLVFSEKFDPSWTLQTIAQERIDILSGVPAMLGVITTHPAFATADLSSVRYVSWGAGPISEQVLDALLNKTQALFSQQYGMTESNGPISYTPPTRDRAVLLATTGRPDPRLDFRIFKEQESDEDGEIQVRQPCPFLGYLNNQEATIKVWTEDSYLRTGDRGYLREDGFLVFSGRDKEMYKSGGYNVYPREVEIALERHPSIICAAVLGVPDDQWGEVGYAFVEVQHPLRVDELREWCKARLANYKVPKMFATLDSMPRTSVGKVDRQSLLALQAAS